jgi:putative lipoprotein
VTYLQRIALPADAVIKVRLFDVTRRRTMIAEQIIRAEGRQVPFAFDVQYDPGRIEPSHQYVIEARIENRGRLLFVSTKSYPVITDGSSNTARIVVNRVGR